MKLNNKLSILNKNKNFKFFWYGYTFLIYGNWITTIALNLYVWNLYQSPMYTSINIAINMIPTVIFGPFFGIFVDNFDHRKMGIYLNIFNVLILLFPILSVEIIPIYLFSFLSGLISAIRYPWLQSYVPKLVNESSLIKANSSISFSKTSAQLVAPIIVGALTAFNIKFAFLTNIVLVLLSIIIFINISKIGRQRNKLYKVKLISVLSDMKNGLFIMYSQRSILIVCVFMILLLLLDGMVDVITIIFVKDILNASDYQYSFVSTVQGIGMVLASVSIGIILTKYKKSLWHILFLFGGIKILTTIAFVYSPNYVVFIIIMLIESYFWIGSTIVENSLLQSSIPSEHRGKIYAFYGSFCWLASFCGTLIIGSLVSQFGIRHALIYSTILIALLLILFYIIVKCKNRFDFSSSYHNSTMDQ